MERVHKVAAIVVFAFLCLHFASHFAGLFGPDAQTQVMDAVRILYRYPPVEYAVFAAFAVLVLTGLPLVWEIWTKPKDFVHQLQAASGLIMTLFIAVHIGWVLYVRDVLHNETSFAFVHDALASARWGRAVLAVYGAGLGALSLHAGCILYGIFKKTNKAVAWTLLVAMTGLGGYVSWLLLVMYAGLRH